MQEKRKAGIWISLILGLYSMLGTLYVFVVSDHWREMWEAKAVQYSGSLGIARVDEAFIVEYVIPALHDLAFLGGAIMVVAAYLYAKNHKNAWHVGLIGNLIAVQGLGFPVIGAASAGIFPEYTYVFLPIFAGFYLYIAYLRRYPAKVITWATVIGMTYVLALFNGIASASRMSQMEAVQLNNDTLNGFPQRLLDIYGADQLQQIGWVPGWGLADKTPMFEAVQQINWIGMIGWGVVLVAFLFQKKWVIPVAIFSAILNILGGVPLGIDSMTGPDATVFSMFLIAPIFSLIILVYFLMPSGEKFVLNWADDQKYKYSEGRDLNV